MYQYYHTQSKHTKNKYIVVKNGISCIVKMLKLVCSGQLSDVKFRSLGFIQSRMTQFLRPAPGFSIKVLK